MTTALVTDQASGAVASHADVLRLFTRSSPCLYGRGYWCRAHCHFEARLNKIVNRTLAMYSDHLQVTTAFWIFNTDWEFAQACS